MSTSIDIGQSVRTGWVVYRRSGWAVAGMIANGFLRLFTLAACYFPCFIWLTISDRSEPLWCDFFFLVTLLLALNATIGCVLIRKLVTISTGDEVANHERVRTMLSRDFPNYKVTEAGARLIKASWNSDFSPVSREMLFLLADGCIGVNNNSLGRQDWRWMSLALFNYRRSRQIARRLAAS